MNLASITSLTTTAIGAGTFFKLGDQILTRGYGGLKSEVPNFVDAIGAGVKFFDGAFAYGDGPKLKEALAGRDVQNFVLSSKIPGFKLDINDLAGSTEKCFNGILASLGVNSIDIMYLHGPDCIHEEVLDKLVELKEEKKVNYIGLCNVDAGTLEVLLKKGYPIAVVQNEFNPHFWDEEVLDLCHSNKIVLVGYRQYGDKESNKIFENETLKKIAFRVQSSVQAVILQWMYQHGVTSIPHSNNKERIKLNACVPDWQLTGEEMEQIDAIKVGKASTCGWKEKLHKELFAKSNQWILNAKY